MSRPPSATRGWRGPQLIGLLLILLGGALLLRNAGIVTFDWSVIWALLIVAVLPVQSPDLRVVMKIDRR